MFHDDQSSPQVAVQLASQIVASHPAVEIGANIVAMCNAMAPLMQAGPAMFCLSPGIHPASGSYVFTSSVSTYDLARALITYFRSKGWTKLALMTSTDASGQDAEKGINADLALPENKDVKVVAREHFNPTDVSVSAQIENIKAAGPQALIAWTTGAPVGTIFKGIVQAGLDVPVGTTDGNMTFAQMNKYSAFLPKQLYPGRGMGDVRHQPAARSCRGGGAGAFRVDLQGGEHRAGRRLGPCLGSGDDRHRRAAQARPRCHCPTWHCPTCHCPTCHCPTCHCPPVIALPVIALPVIAPPVIARSACDEAIPCVGGDCFVASAPRNDRGCGAVASFAVP